MAVPILLAWIAVAAVSNALAPQLEVVGAERSVSMNSPDAPSYKAMKHIGQVFGEFDSDSSAMVVLEGDKPLGAEAHHYYDGLVQRLRADTRHVQHVQDFWGDPLTAGGSQSKDGLAAYVQIYLAGNQGQALANESVGAVRTMIANTAAPEGVSAYVTGATPLLTDQLEVGSEGTDKVTMLTFGVIALMLLFVYRSLVTMVIVLATVLIEVAAARGVVRLLSTVDPGGVRVELVFGPAMADAPFASPLVPSGFVADGHGLGHLVVSTGDDAATGAFYQQLLGFRLSDRIVCQFYGFDVDITFLHTNARHHSLAFGGKQPKRLHHFLLEVGSLDDVGAALDRCAAAGVRIAQSLGRHPNDRMVSFYALTPSGFQFEYGTGGRLVDDASWQPTIHDRISEWGHHPPERYVPRRPRPPRPDPERDGTPGADGRTTP